MTTKQKETLLYACWLAMYILCAGLGTVDQIEGVGKTLFVLTSLIFFIPGIWLLVMGKQEKNKKIVLRVRILAICSLSLTVIVFCITLFSLNASPATAAFLDDLLNLVSVPMFCARYWVLSLFGWACLLSGSFVKTK